MNYTHGGNVQVLGPEVGYPIDQLLDFSANINPFGPPENVETILKESFNEIAFYPDPNYGKLRSAIANFHNLEKENIAVANGASELIFWAARFFSNPFALIFAPSFTEYTAAVKSCFGELQYECAKEGTNFQHSFDQELPDLKTNLIFLANPNNPTGHLTSAKTLMNWIERHVPKYGKHLVICDESFMPFIQNDLEHSLIPYALRDSRILILRSLTKILSIPGLRLGYCVGSKEIIEKFNSLMPTWRVNIFAQKIGEKIKDFEKFMIDSSRMLALLKNNLIKDLQLNPFLKIFKSSTNFLLVKILNPKFKSSELTESLLKKGILIRSCNDFFGLEQDQYLRIAVRKENENNRLLDKLKEIFYAS
ncbi:MAG: aminotransferase class I/II-fold pyridoxal phosphate-dependent enzyme [Elusimicrobia bacterium]|nr:aminotransferase class I/II-fold pyridoxal phosphate-dependent enzyme [Elusimicrobiota bacterium]